MTRYIQVMTTAGNQEDAQEIAEAIVSKRLAACVQVIGPITSTYWWRAKIQTEEEWLCVMKSREDLYDRLQESVRQIHPYEVPEILATPVTLGSRSYLAWLTKELKEK